MTLNLLKNFTTKSRKSVYLMKGILSGNAQGLISFIQSEPPGIDFCPMTVKKMAAVALWT
jgi:hypothetical protein